MRHENGREMDLHDEVDLGRGDERRGVAHGRGGVVANLTQIVGGLIEEFDGGGAHDSRARGGRSRQSMRTASGMWR